MTASTDKKEQKICIASLRRGDSNAFTQFVIQYQDMVFACCRAVGLRDDEVEDVAEETFLAAYKSIQSYTGQGKLSSWLWKIAYYKALDYRKKMSGGTIPSSDTMETLAAPTSSPETNLSAEEQSNAVWQAVQRLPQPQAAAIVLYYRENKVIEEIADILKIPKNSIKTYLHRGRKELYNLLHSVWETNYVQK